MVIISLSMGCEPTPEGLLVGIWARSFEEVLAYDSDEYVIEESCRSDDVLEYTTSSWTLLQGTTLCEGSVPGDISRGGWRLVGDSLLETADGAVGEFEATIEQLDDETFIRSHDTFLVEGPGVPRRIRWTHGRVE